MIIQLNPPLPLLTPKGSGLAHLMLDYGPEFDLHWTVFLDDTGECWTFRNREVRACKNITLGRVDVAKPEAQHPPLDVNKMPNHNDESDTRPADGAYSNGRF